MRAVIDTSSLVSLVRYYLPFDNKGILFKLIKEKFLNGEIILIDAVHEECKYVSQKIVVKSLSYLDDKEFLKENKFVVKTEDLIPLAPIRFLNMVKNQFIANQFQFKKLSEAEYEGQKMNFMESADAKLIMYCQHLMKDNPEEEIYLVTEESISTNDLKLFKKIPAICTILGIKVIGLPELLAMFTELDLAFG